MMELFDVFSTSWWTFVLHYKLFEVIRSDKPFDVVMDFFKRIFDELFGINTCFWRHDPLFGVMTNFSKCPPKRHFCQQKAMMTRALLDQAFSCWSSIIVTIIVSFGKIHKAAWGDEFHAVDSRQRRDWIYWEPNPVQGLISPFSAGEANEANDHS